jgi:hypothetical protein
MNVFKPQERDKNSPLTGMGRDQWIEAGKYLLHRYEGLYDKEAQEYLPPDPRDQVQISRRFELFTRMALLIAPLAKADPSLRIYSESAVDFLCREIRRYTDEDSADWIGIPQGEKSPFQLVQWAGLVMALWCAPEDVWVSLGKVGQHKALQSLNVAAHSRTNTHNWRFFNVLAFAFLSEHGFPFDQEQEYEHLEQLSSWYAGDGWYRDGHDFDYYTAWAFQAYTALWCSRPRSHTYSAIREQFLHRFRIFLHTYPRFFSREGYSLLWGRSAVYRFAASAPFPLAFTVADNLVEGGLARKICSGNLLQFLQRDNIWDGAIPSLGYYRAFPPMIQPYTATSSFGWMHKVFSCLSLPPSSPFWSAPEIETPWYRGSASTEALQLTGPALMVANDASSGDVYLFPGKVRTYGHPCYNRLVYSAHNLLEADPTKEAGGMSYYAKTTEPDATTDLRVSRTRFGGFSSGVMYRQIYLGDRDGHHSEGILIDLADIPLATGFLRIDRVRSSFSHQLAFGSFSVPYPGEMEQIEESGIVMYTLRPQNAKEPTFSIIPLLGWETVILTAHTGTHAEFSVNSQLQLLKKVSHSSGENMYFLAFYYAPGRIDPSLIPRIDPWFNDRRVSREGVTVQLPDGRSVVVDFRGIEGRLAD